MRASVNGAEADGSVMGWQPGEPRKTLLVAAVVFLCGCLGSVPLVAETFSPATPDILHLGSLRGHVTGQPPGGKSWYISMSIGYFNIGSHSWHLFDLHRIQGSDRVTVDREHLDLLEQQYPAETMGHVDLEGWRADVIIARRLHNDLILSLSIPFLSIGSPNWDSLPEVFHRAVGLPSGRREAFTRGQTVIYAYGPRGRFAAFEDLEDSRFGDITVSLAGPMGRLWGGEHRWVAALQPPTGKRDTLWGSGGWDFGGRVESSWLLSRGGTRIETGFGFSWLDQSGSWFGFRRRNTWHAAASLELPLSVRTRLLLGTRWERSPIADFGPFSRSCGSWTAAVRRTFEDGQWVAFAFGEDAWGVMPDFSLQLWYGLTFP